MGQSRALFVYFRLFNMTKNDKSLDGVLGTQTRGGRMIGADKSTELWLLPRGTNGVGMNVNAPSLRLK